MIERFDSPEFGTLRTVEEDGKVLFCGKDVAVALGYKDATNAIKKHCKGVPIHHPLKTAGGTQQARFITQGDVYRLITHSKLPSAQRFESWVFDEVLPSIARDGGYMVARADETPEQLMARALKIADETLKRQQAQIEELKPKALFADAVAASDGTCLVGEFAKMLRQNGVDIGQNRLFAWLRDHGYLGKSGSNRNVPTQRAMDMGLFRIKETAVTHSDGHVTINRTPKLTGRGQRHLLDKSLGGAA
jgi:anti-repressor protein